MNFQGHGNGAKIPSDSGPASSDECPSTYPVGHITVVKFLYLKFILLDFSLVKVCSKHDILDHV